MAHESTNFSEFTRTALTVNFTTARAEPFQNYVPNRRLDSSPRRSIFCSTSLYLAREFASMRPLQTITELVSMQSRHVTKHVMNDRSSARSSELDHGSDQYLDINTNQNSKPASVSLQVRYGKRIRKKVIFKVKNRVDINVFTSHRASPVVPRPRVKQTVNQRV